MHSTLLQILRGNWYIDQEFAFSAGFLVKSMLENKLRFEGDALKFQPVVTSYDSVQQSSNEKVSRSIAVISITGPLMKHDQECGPAGMDTIGRWVKAFDADPNISAIIFDFDCPGGTVSGTATLGNTIKDCKKPTIAFVNEMACSGAYWLSSQCKKIVASIPRARIGSIGVMLSFIDVQPAWEMEGYVFHDIVSDLSPDKNKEWQELRAKNYENYKKNVLNPLAVDFHNVVKSTRTITDESIFKGRVVFADEAKAIGLIDEIANWEETLAMANQMGDDYEQALLLNANNHLFTKSTIDMKFNRIAVVTGVESFESTEDGIHVQQDFLAAIETALETAETEATQREEIQRLSDERAGIITQHEARIAELTPQAAEAETLRTTVQQNADIIAANTARIAELEAEVNALRQLPGANSATIVPKADDGKEKDVDPIIAEVNAAKSTVERMEILEKHGYV